MQNITSPQKQTAHLKDYIRILIARRWVIIGVLVLTVLSVAAYVIMATPVYRAEATLLIEPSKIKLTEFKDVYDPISGESGGALERREYYATQHKLMASRSLLEKTFDEFKFGEMEEFLHSVEPIKKFEGLFSVKPVQRTRLVIMTFSWKDAELAAKVLEYHVNSFIMDYRQRSLGVSLGGSKTLKKKAEELRPKLEIAAGELQKFMVSNNMVSLEESQNIVVDRLKELSKNLSVAENERIQYQSVVDSIHQELEANRSLKDIPEAAESKIIQDLKLEYIRSKKEFDDISQRFGSNHSEVKAIKARIATIVSKIKIERRSIMASSEAKLRRAQKQAEDLKKELTEQEQRVMELNRVSGKYNILKEAHETLKRTYQAIDTRIKEIEISLAAGSQDDNIFVIEKPRAPTKAASPKRLLSVVLASVAGLIMGTMLAFFVNYFDTSIKSKDETESILGVPVIGFIPAFEDKDSAKSNDHGVNPDYLRAINDHRSSIAEAFRSIRTSLEFANPEGETKSLLVTSAAPGDGKTIVSVNLAIAMAKAGKNVLLVDCDMRIPRIHKVF